MTQCQICGQTSALDEGPHPVSACPLAARKPGQEGARDTAKKVLRLLYGHHAGISPTAERYSAWREGIEITGDVQELAFATLGVGPARDSDHAQQLALEVIG